MALKKPIKKTLKRGRKSVQARKQRFALAKAKLHGLQNLMHSQLNKVLREKYRRRSIQIKKGDTVKVMRGQFTKKEGKIERIDLKRRKVYVAGVELVKQDKSKVAYPLNPSNLQVQLLGDIDAKRKVILHRQIKKDND
jgi:large subunit ribosomal protein L24